MNTYSQAQHKISQVSQSFNTATSGQFGRRDGPDGFQEPQSGYMPREFSVSVGFPKLSSSWPVSLTTFFLLILSQPPERPRRLSMEARRTLTSSPSRTPRRVIPVRSSRCTEVDLLLTTNTVTIRPVLLPVSTTTTALAATEVLLKVTRRPLDLLSSSSSTTAARKADHRRLRRTNTGSNSTEHRRATTRGTVIMGRVATRAAAAIRETETGDREVIRRDGRLLRCAFGSLGPAAIVSSFSSSSTLPYSCKQCL